MATPRHASSTWLLLLLSGSTTACQSCESTRSRAPETSSARVPPAPSAVASGVQPNLGVDAARCVERVIVEGSSTCFEFNRDYYWCSGSDYETSVDPVSGTPTDSAYRTLPFHFDRLFLTGTLGCGANSDGKLWCWGASTHGPIPGERGYIKKPTLMTNVPAPVDDLSSSSAPLCIRTGDQVSCFDRERLEPISGLGTPIRQVDSGGYLGCASKEDSVWCWGCYPWAKPEPTGDRHRSICEMSGEQRRAVPIDLPRDLRIKSLQVGAGNGCVLSQEGSVYCFGHADSGIWGDGQYPSCENEPCPQHDFREPHFVKSLGKSVRELGMGGGYACALKQDGTIWCWGANQYQVVRKEQNEVKQPNGSVRSVEALPRQRVELGSDNRHLMTGSSHACVEKNDGSLWCWGRDPARGYGAEIPSPRRVELPSPRCPTP